MNLSRLLNQTAVYWGTPVADGFGGFAYADPVEIAVRWEDKQDKFMSGSGAERISKSIVYSETDFDLNGYLLQGTLDDLDSTQDPQVEANAFIIQGTAKVPNIKGTTFLRKAYL